MSLPSHAGLNVPSSLHSLRVVAFRDYVASCSNRLYAKPENVTKCVCEESLNSSSESNVCKNLARGMTGRSLRKKTTPCTAKSEPLKSKNLLPFPSSTRKLDSLTIYRRQLQIMRDPVMPVLHHRILLTRSHASNHKGPVQTKTQPYGAQEPPKTKF